jgi:N-ethylmaleimide reductase
MDEADPEALFHHVVAELNKRGLAYLHLVEPTVKGREIATNRSPRAGPDARHPRQLLRPIILAGGYTAGTPSRRWPMVAAI